MDTAELQAVIEYISGYPHGGYLGVRRLEGEEPVNDFQHASFTQSEMQDAYQKLIDDQLSN